MAQTRVLIPESPSPTYNQPHVIPPWQHYREGIRPSNSSTSRTSASSSHSRSRTIPVCPSPRRTRTTGGTSDHHHSHYHQATTPHSHQQRFHQHAHSSSHYKEGRKPWEHMAQTYSWVLEQEIAEMTRKNEETIRWIMEQQEREARERTVFAMLGLENKYRDMMEQLVDDFEDLAEQLKAHEAHRRQNAMHWQREMAYDDFRRQEQAWRQEAENYRMAYDRKRAQAVETDRRRRDLERQRVKAVRDQAEKEAWQKYEEDWAALNPSAEPSAVQLTFKTIPWPLVSAPSQAEDITPARVAMFLLSPNHSEGVPRRERIKNALRRWHPDRFGRLLSRVTEEDKAVVEESVGIVARCLNGLLERDNKMIASTPQNH